jgi:hypothetical protein
VHDNVKFQLVKQQDTELWSKKINLATVKDKYSDILVLYPDNQFLDFFQRNKNSRIEVAETKSLYRIIPVK